MSFVWVTLGITKPVYQASFDHNAEAVFFDVEIDGKMYPFLFDTGATFTVLDEQFESKLGKPLTKPEVDAMLGYDIKSLNVLTPTGEMTLPFYKPISMRVGSLMVPENTPVIAANLKGLWPIIGQPFYGVIGTSFLHQYVWTIDFDKGILTADTKVTSRDVMNADMMLDIRWSGLNIPQIPIRIGEHVIAFDVDTGDVMSGTIQSAGIQYMDSQKMLSSIQTSEMITVDGILKTNKVRVKRLNIGGTEYPGLVVTEAQGNAIGMGFLKRHQVILDFPGLKLYLTREPNYLKRDEVDKSGLKLINVGNQIQIYEVVKGSSAAIISLKKNDIILSVNGKTVTGKDLLTVRKWFRGKPGAEYRLAVRQGNQKLNSLLTLSTDPLP